MNIGRVNFPSLSFRALVWLVVFLFTGLLIAAPELARAQSQDEVQKLLAGDGASGDGFGWSVSISGNYAIVGVPYDGDRNIDFGSAYLYERDSSGQWNLVQKLSASDGMEGDWFGWSVSISGNFAIVGAWRDYNNGIQTGSAYVYERSSTGQWIEQKLTPSDGEQEDRFGYSVSISESLAIVGAPWDDERGTDSGSAYVYERGSDGQWRHVSTLSRNDDPATYEFGQSVSISGTFAIVGAARNVGEGLDTGSAYIFEYQGSDFWIVHPLSASDGAPEDRFGFSVSISEGLAIVGAPWDDDRGAESGSAYVYERGSNGHWSQIDKLTASDGAQDDSFGWSVSISDSLAIVGVAWDDDRGTNSGSAYVYGRNSNGAWTERKLMASDGATNDLFGYSVAISGKLAVVGAYSDYDEGSSSGSAYAFDLSPEVPAITDPAPGSELTGGSQVFTLSPGASGANEYWIYAGSTLGGAQYSLGRNLGNVPTVTISGLPTDGSVVYIRLWYRVAGDASWYWLDEQYTASTLPAPQLVAPPPGSILSSGAETLQWADNGSSATAYWLYAGSSVGGAQYYNSGNLGTATSTSVNTLPTDGSTVYVRLWYQAGSSAWQFVDATYTAASLAGPEISSPVPDSTLAGTAVTFSWTDNAAGVTNWWLYAGTTLGGAQYFNSGNLGNATSVNVTGLPDDGSIVQVRLWYQAAGSSAWQFVDASYTATGSPPAQITSPAPGSTLTGASATFNWTDNGSGVEQWWLYVGSAPGLSDYHDSGSVGTATSYTAGGLPLDGSTVYVSLWYRIGAIWQYESFSYTNN